MVKFHVNLLTGAKYPQTKANKTKAWDLRDLKHVVQPGNVWGWFYRALGNLMIRIRMNGQKTLHR